MSVTLHTTLGNIKIEIFCESVPKTAEVSPLQPLYASITDISVRTFSPYAPRVPMMAARFTARYQHS